jgi:esterase/lipase
MIPPKILSNAIAITIICIILDYIIIKDHPHIIDAITPHVKQHKKHKSSRSKQVKKDVDKVDEADDEDVELFSDVDSEIDNDIDSIIDMYERDDEEQD